MEEHGEDEQEKVKWSGKNLLRRKSDEMETTL